MPPPTAAPSTTAMVTNGRAANRAKKRPPAAFKISSGSVSPGGGRQSLRQRLQIGAGAEHAALAFDDQRGEACGGIVERLPDRGDHFGRKRVLAARIVERDPQAAAGSMNAKKGAHRQNLATPNELGRSALCCASAQVSRQKAKVARLSRGSIRPSSQSRAVAKSAVD